MLLTSTFSFWKVLNATERHPKNASVVAGFAAQHRFQRLWGRQSSADVFVPSQRTQAAHRQLKRARAVAEAITLQAEDKWIERTLNALHNEQVHPR